MILAAILFLCKLGGQDVKIIFGIRHFWIQHTQIDLKSHRYRFFPHLHLTSFSRLLLKKWTLSIRVFRETDPESTVIDR